MLHFCSVFTNVANFKTFHSIASFQVIMDRYYKAESGRDMSTLYQLKVLTQRTNVVTQVTKDYHADSAFFDNVFDCHVVAAAMTFLEMLDVTDTPANMPNRIEATTDEHKKRILSQVARSIIDKYAFGDMSEVLNDLVESNKSQQDDKDGVYNYATGILKYGMLRRVSVIATASGDGLRALRHWRFALLAYHQGQKTNYKLEAFLITAAVKALLPERFAEEVTWSRFVNLTGGPGKNLDADYTLELFNKAVKAKLKTMGPNNTPEQVMRASRTIMFCDDLSKSLAQQLKVSPTSRDHTQQDLAKDKSLIIDQLRNKTNVFTHTPGRRHAHFNEPRDIFSRISGPEIHRWIAEKKKKYSSHCNWAF